jgi:hypothetical protein
MKKYPFQKLIAWLLLIMTGLYMLTGFGISQARIVTTLTYGILNKVICFKIHDYLWLPFIILLLFHLFLSLRIHHISKLVSTKGRCFK